MGPFSKKFRPEYAKILLKIAEGDLKTAEALLDNKHVRPENICFLAQQAIEKCIKAVLCHKNLSVPQVHDLEALVATIPDNCPPIPGMERLGDLTEFATIRRYEEGYHELEPTELLAVVKTARECVEWGKKLVK